MAGQRGWRRALPDLDFPLRFSASRPSCLRSAMSVLQTLLKSAAYQFGFSLRRLRPAQRFERNGTRFDGRLRPLLHRVDPYQDFDPTAWPDDASGWGSDSPAFGEWIDLLKPARIIEVGSWKGGSALTLARHQQRHGIDGEILCVDTWLGALEMWTDLDDPTRHGSLALHHGYPSLYYTFLANVARAGQQSRITPFPIPSITAAQWCALRGVTAGLIYIDGSHEEEDVYQDLVVWWDLVAAGGILGGDDWSWDGVRLAVQRFARENQLTIGHRHDKWELMRSR
jgi:hypothetical protein